MFEDALRYPWNDGDGAETILIGTVLSLLGVLLVPLVLVAGYTLRVMRAVATDGADPSLPEWTDWGDLFVDGLRAIVVTLVYVIVPTALLAATILAFFVPLAGEVPRVVSLLAIGVALLSVPVAIAAAYVLPAALVAVATSGRLGAGVAVRQLWPVVTSGSYLTGWLVGLAVSILASVVGGLLAATVVGAILTPVVAFYASVATTYCYARGVAGARSVPGRSNDRPDEQVA